jgi:hypothetical protein
MERRRNFKNKEIEESLDKRKCSRFVKECDKGCWEKKESTQM